MDLPCTGGPCIVHVPVDNVEMMAEMSKKRPLFYANNLYMHLINGSSDCLAHVNQLLLTSGYGAGYSTFKPKEKDDWKRSDICPLKYS